MQQLEPLIILDAASIILMFVLASLSKRLGEALKIREFYRLFHVGVVLVLVATIISITISTTHQNIGPIIARLVPNALRLAAGLLAVLTCLPYWKWLFPEHFKR